MQYLTLITNRDPKSNWAVDLAKNLEDYLLKIYSREITAEVKGGHPSVNFVEGLIVIKTLIIAVIGPCVGLTFQESVQIGQLLSQGGEFSFVVFLLANRLGVVPLELNKLLIIIVVLSMKLTPFLNEVGRKATEINDEKFEGKDILLVQK